MSDRPPGTNRRSLIAGLGAAAILGALPARAEESLRLTMVSAWPKGAPGVGVNAERFAAEMTDFETKRLPVDKEDIAPDGSDVRVLLGLEGGGMAHFELGPGQTSRAVTHRTVEEIWYFLGGRGEMWRQQRGREEVVPIDPGVCLTIPLGTHFQFRSFGYEPLSAIGVTMPPWPGPGEAVVVDGKWETTVT